HHEELAVAVPDSLDHGPGGRLLEAAPAARRPRGAAADAVVLLVDGDPGARLGMGAGRNPETLVAVRARVLVVAAGAPLPEEPGRFPVLQDVRLGRERSGRRE